MIFADKVLRDMRPGFRTCLYNVDRNKLRMITEEDDEACEQLTGLTKAELMVKLSKLSPGKRARAARRHG